jgi:hypothetical protein
MTITTNQLEDLLRPSAIEEVWRIQSVLTPADLTSSELLGMVAILRPALERFNAAKATPAQLTLAEAASSTEPKAARPRLISWLDSRSDQGVLRFEIGKPSARHRSPVAGRAALGVDNSAAKSGNLPESCRSPALGSMTMSDETAPRSRRRPRR